MTTALVFPVGHYLGPEYDGVTGTARPAVRVGTDRHELTDGQFDTWLLAHGATGSDGPDRAPWTTQDLRAAARAAGVTETVDVLHARGLVALVEPGAAERFARTHRVAPLQIGFGNHEDEPAAFGIGLPGTPPAAVVDAATYQLWLWGHAAESLWDVCTVLAAAVAQSGASTPSATDVLADLLGGLRVLLSRSAAYLDTVS